MQWRPDAHERGAGLAKLLLALIEQSQAIRIPAKAMAQQGYGDTAALDIFDKGGQAAILDKLRFTRIRMRVLVVRLKDGLCGGNAILGQSGGIIHDHR